AVALDAQARHRGAAAADAQIVKRLRVRVDVAQLDVDPFVLQKITHARAVRTTGEVIQRVVFAHGSPASKHGRLCRALVALTSAAWAKAGLNATLRAIRSCAESPLSQSKPTKRVANMRNGVIAFVALLIVVVVGYGLFRSSAVDVSGDFVEGTHYKVIQG